jgi:GNAT superfamily N-acetyltransferase
MFLKPDFTLATPADDRELAACLDIVAQSLHFPRELADRFAKIVGREHFRVIRSSGGRGAPSPSSIVGGLALHEMGQFFGGRSVKMFGVGAVGIAPEHRASGAATAMMTQVVREMHERGVPISTLYPATRRIRTGRFAVRDHDPDSADSPARQERSSDQHRAH